VTAASGTRSSSRGRRRQTSVEAHGAGLPLRRGYQDEAVAAIVDGLAGGGRGTAVLACGTGKTLVGAHATVHLVAAGLVVVACPSLALVAQTLGVWSAAGVPDAVLAVCSDTTVADTAVHVSDLRCPVTTDAHQVAAWLRRTSGARLRLMLVTHQSAAVLGQGLIAADATPDLLVVDEAHRTAGRMGKQAAALHRDEVLPARRRLYMTATPKVMTTRRGDGDTAALSMDNPDTFGHCLFTYPFADAIADGWLDDYRVVVIGVTRGEVLRVLRGVGDTAALGLTGASLRTMVVQAALGKAAVEFGLRRVLAFTALVKESKDFAATLAGTLASLPAPYRPKGLLTAVHVDGAQSVSQRQVALGLLADPPQDGWTVLSNARCLSEGVDVPAVDGVVFASPKESEIDIVQAVGRALRRNPRGSGIATVLVPVLLPDDPDHATDDYDEWATVCRVVRALRAHDATLGAQLDEHRARTATGDSGAAAALPQRILIRLPDGYGMRDVLQHITVRVLQDTTSSWWASFGELRAFHAERGHFLVADGTRLGDWMRNQRRFYHRRILDPERIAALEGLGFEWAPQQRAQERGLAAAQAFHATHGHLKVPEDYPSEGIDLHSWLVHQRNRNAFGTLPADLKTALGGLGMRWEKLGRVTWRDACDLAAAFYAEHRHLRLPTGYTVDGFDLYFWLCQQRGDARSGKLSAQRAAALDAIGMVWDLDEARWQDRFAAAAAFARREGHLKPPTAHREGDINLYAWLTHQRKLHRRGSLATERIDRLVSIGMTW
jgi:superfamily II DNA or RNA helicase